MSSSDQNVSRSSTAAEGVNQPVEPSSRPTSPGRTAPFASRLLSQLSERQPRRTSTSPLRDEWNVNDQEGHDVKTTFRKPPPPWLRKHGPKLVWKSHFDKNPKTGRVLVIDYMKEEDTRAGMRKVAAREIHHLHALEKLYSPDAEVPVLRLFHLQSAEWAVDFLIDKLAIDTDTVVGNDFAEYVKNSKPEKRGGKPLLRGRNWAPQHDPWRGINKIAFGLDYIKLYPSKDPLAAENPNDNLKFLELNTFDTATDLPRYGWDACAQRISCYIQRQEDQFDPSEGSDVSNPYVANRTVDHFDNGNTIVVIETCKSNNIEGTLIKARGDKEQRWRRLPFQITADQHTIKGDDDLALQCMQYITQDIWDAVGDSWEEFLDKADEHVAILEEKIYEQPADESRADEIWRNSSNWLKVERIVNTHSMLVKTLNKNLREYIEEDEDQGWLEDQVERMTELLNQIAENLIKPTDSLSDLMYKSVGIRDTRHSLELSYSMWRLSWITFIFLPLNYSTSFFGMNVDIFADDPAVKWYFISAVPLLLLVFVTYWMFKHMIMQSRQTPYSRGIYERFFHELAEKYPLLWSRIGPRKNVRLGPLWQRLQWFLIKRWNEPEKTITNPLGTDDDQFDGLGTWQHAKKVMTRRWTAELGANSAIDMEPEAQKTYLLPEKYAKATTVQNLDEVLHEADMDSYELRPAIPPSQPQNLLPVPGLTDAVTTRGGGSPRTRFSLLSTSSRDRRSSHDSQRSAPVMVEEQEETWLCGDWRQKKEAKRQRKSVDETETSKPASS